MSGQPFRMLVVEDDEDDFVLLQHMLRHSMDGARIERAASAQQALDCTTRNAYGLVFLDYRLGAETGLDLLRSLRQRTYRGPVIFLTGHGDEDVAVEAMKAGATDYLVKSKLTDEALSRSVNYAVSLYEKEQAVEAAHQQLCQSERHYRMLFENANDAILIFDPETEEILEANRSACESYGYPRQELIGRNLLTLTRDLERSRERVADIKAKGSTRNFQTVHLRRDGSEIPMLCNSSLIEYRGKPAILTLNRDVGELQQARQAVELNEMRLEALLELNRMTGQAENELTHFALERGIQLTGSRYGYLAFADQTQQALHLHAWSDAVLRDCAMTQRQTVYRLEEAGLWTEALARRSPVVINRFAEARGEKPLPEGHVPLDSFMSVPIFDGEKVAVVAGVANKAAAYNESDVRQLKLLMEGMWHILQRQRSEGALRESERRYRLLFEHNLAGVFRASAEGRVLECNDAMAHMLGHSSGTEVVGLNVTGLYFDSGDREVVLRRMSQQGQLVNEEVKMRRTDNKPVWLLMNVLERTDERGMVSLEGTAVDISERRQLQEQLLQSQKMDAVGQMAGGIAHDFNNLLMIITSYAEVLGDSVQENAALSKSAGEIQKAARKAAGLTRQLLAFSRKQVMSPRLMDLNQVIADAGKLLPRLIGENIEIAVAPGGHLWAVKADPVQLDQVLMNLAVNARDAMPRGGKLTLETRNVHLDEEYARIHAAVQPGDYVMLAVTDTGCGIPPDILPHIFEPFFTTKEVGHGTGLGLPTVYGIVKQSGGSVWVYSELSRGTVFKIYLPRALPETALEGAVAEPMQTAGSETVLLVEDEEALRQVTADFLRARGYQVLPACSGADALTQARDHGGVIHVLVTDVIMPGLSGRELAEKLLAARPGMRVLYMSGYTEATVVQHGVEPGTMFLQKPFVLRDLAARVRELLESPAAMAA